MVPLRDGTRTRADLYLPDTGHPCPTLLARTPYSKVLTEKELMLLNPLRAARRGYAVVMQDCRGRFGSEGDFRPFFDEAGDGADSIAWCAAQPWSTGRVATWGMSYYGATQLLAASTSPPALAAMAPVATPSRYDAGWFLEGGVLRQDFTDSWVGLLAGESARRAGDRAVDLDRHAAWYARVLEHRDDPRWWDPFAPDQHYPAVQVPGLHVTTWFDLFLEGTIANYVGLRSSAGSARARAGQRLVIGPGDHGLFTAALGEQFYGHDWIPDLPNLHFRFFDRHLRARPDEAPPEPDEADPVSVYVLGADRWCSLPDWPPPARPSVWHLGGADARSLRGDGSLSERVSPPTTPHIVVFDPRGPVPTLGGALLGLSRHRPGPFDQRVVEARPDVLVYTSPPLAEPLTIMGCVRADVCAHADAASFDLCVKLVDVDPSGRAVNLADGVRRTRSGCRGPDAETVEVEIGSVAVVIGPGHRIRLEIAASNWPRLELNPAGATRITVDPARSRLVLPVVDGLA